MAAFNNETCSSDHMFKTLKSLDLNNNATEECSITTDFKSSRENEQEKSATAILAAKRNASTQKNDVSVLTLFAKRCCNVVNIRVVKVCFHLKSVIVVQLLYGGKNSCAPSFFRWLCCKIFVFINVMTTIVATTVVRLSYNKLYVKTNLNNILQIIYYKA